MALSPKKQREKEWMAIIRQKAKEMGWKFKEWFAFKADELFFYSFDFTIYPDSIVGVLKVKPLIVDEKF